MTSSAIDHENQSTYSEFLNMEPAELYNMLLAVEKILDAEPKLVMIPESRCLFIGDTHGEFGITRIALTQIHGIRQTYFLGGFIDRGPSQIENVNVLLGLKVKYPDKIILIRGTMKLRGDLTPATVYEAVCPTIRYEDIRRNNRIFF